MKKYYFILVLLSLAFIILIVPYILFPLLFLPNFLSNPVFYCLPGNSLVMYGGTLIIMSMFFLFLLGQFRSTTPSKTRSQIQVRKSNYFLLSAMSLVSLAIVIIFLSLFIGRADIIRGTFIVAGFGCFFGGVLIVIFDKNEYAKQNTLGALLHYEPLQQYRMLRELGIKGNAWFFNDQSPNNRLIFQFNPASEFWHPKHLTEQRMFYREDNATGISTIPLGYHLLALIKDTYGLTVPSNEDDLRRAIREVLEEALETADKVMVEKKGKKIFEIKQINYYHFAECVSLRQKNPGLCQKSPCANCGFISCMLVEGLKDAFTISSVALDGNSKTLTITISNTDNRTQWHPSLLHGD